MSNIDKIFNPWRNPWSAHSVVSIYEKNDNEQKQYR